MSDTTVDQGERLDALESVEDGHISEILKNQLNGLYFIDLLPLGILEAVHFFLGLRKGLR